MRASLEPLEERTMLTAVTWTIDQAQSDVTIAIPDQPFEIDDGMGTVYTGTLQVRDQGGNNGGPWGVGNMAEISGTIATDYVDGSSIEFLLGQSNISGVNSGSYIPDAANWNGTDFGGSLDPGPGVFGGRLRPTIDQVLGLPFDVGYFNFTDVMFDVGSAPLAISSGSFPANTTDIGIGSATANLKGLSIILVGQILPDTQELVTDLLDTNQSPTATITSPDPLGQPDLRELTFPILQNFSLELSPGTPPFIGSITGQIVATATIPDDPATVTGRNLFYNNSGYDSNTPGADAVLDASAIASDKSAYLPGGGDSNQSHATSYSKGINGVMVDLTGPHGTLSTADFQFHMSEQGLSANNTPSTWVAAPTPTITVFSDTPVAGTDRVHIIWPDGSIVNRHLEVIVNGDDATGGNNTNTGLAESDIFYFSNQVGDTFTSFPGFFNTDASDEIEARNNGGIAFTPTNAYDFNKDFFVDAGDQILARNNAGFMPMMNISNPPAAPAPPDGDDGSSAVASALAMTATGASSAPAASSGLDDSSAGDTSDADSSARSAAAPTQLVESAVAADSGKSSAVDEALDEDLLDSLIDEI